MTPRLSAPAVLPVMLAGAAALAAAAGTYVLGSALGVGVVLGLIGALLLLAHARAAVLAFVLATIMLESNAEWGVPFAARLYDPVGPISPFEILLLIAVGAVALEVRRPGVEPRLPGPFTVPLAVAALALAGGAVVGVLNGGTAAGIGSNLFTMAPLLIVPFLVVNVVRSREELRRVLGLGGALALVKAVIGLALFFSGLGFATDAAAGQEVLRLTYLEPTTNFLTMAVLLTLAAAVLSRTPMPRWLLLLSPLLVLGLTLSFRRTFWIASVLGLVLIVLLASGGLGRRLIVPALVLVLGAGYLVVAAGVDVELQGPVAARAASLDPSRLRTNEQDRFRLSERRNVLEELRRNPVGGLGLGVDWAARHPLPFTYDFARGHVHTAALWHWLKMGIVGLGAYLWLLAAAVATGMRLWRRHPDGLIRVAALGGAVAVIGLAIVELAWTVIGPDARGTTAFALVLGLLAVAHRDLLTTEPAATAASIGS